MPVKKSQTIEADINVIQRLLVAKDWGRDVDLKTSRELTPVPLALADMTENLRPTNKAALGKILEQRVTAEVLPVSALKYMIGTAICPSSLVRGQNDRGECV